MCNTRSNSLSIRNKTRYQYPYRQEVVHNFSKSHPWSARASTHAPTHVVPFFSHCGRGDQRQEDKRRGQLGRGKPVNDSCCWFVSLVARQSK